MAAPLTWTTEERDGCAIVTLRGELDVAAASRLRVALLKCLAEQPAALLADLAALAVADDTALTLFTAIARQAALWPGTPVLLCAAPPAVDAALRRGRFGALQVRADVATALREATTGQNAPQSISDRLLPVAGAVRHARDLVTEACGRWGLPQLVGPAGLVASELVANGVDHAGTMLTLRLTRTRRYLHVVVRDGSADLPVLDDPGTAVTGGRGLLLVDSLSVRWGSLPATDGKVVWATLSTVEQVP